MKKSEVLAFFDNSVVSVARACGISSPAVTQWGEIIPERNALKLEKVTKGKLKYAPSLYKPKAA